MPRCSTSIVVISGIWRMVRNCPSLSTTIQRRSPSMPMISMSALVHGMAAQALDRIAIEFDDLHAHCFPCPRAGFMSDAGKRRAPEPTAARAELKGLHRLCLVPTPSQGLPRPTAHEKTRDPCGPRVFCSGRARGAAEAYLARSDYSPFARSGLAALLLQRGAQDVAQRSAGVGRAVLCDGFLLFGDFQRLDRHLQILRVSLSKAMTRASTFWPTAKRSGRCSSRSRREVVALDEGLDAAGRRAALPCPPS